MDADRLAAMPRTTLVLDDEVVVVARRILETEPDPDDLDAFIETARHVIIDARHLARLILEETRPPAADT